MIRSKAQLASLSSAIRQDIVDVLAQTGELPVAALARMLGRPADALYYHLRLLERVGLVNSRHKARGDREALYRTPAAVLEIDIEAARRSGTRPLIAAIGSMLRLGIRDYRRALLDETVAVSGRSRELVATRTMAWLPSKAVRDVTRTIEALERVGSGEPGHGRLYAITVLLTPLKPAHRARASRRSRKK